MADQDSAYLRRSVDVRAEIKAWERDFRSSNGQKPSRQDVAANSTIASKYKEYENLRALLAGKAPPHSKNKSRKRKATEHVAQTPTKRAAKEFSTPRRSHQKTRIEEDLVFDTTPQPKVTMIGPTPQKDGIFIGIFDSLPTETPTHNRTILGDVDANSLRTPSKILATPEEIHTGGRHSRTPMSAGKRFMLDQFVTPRKRKATDQATPSSLSKQFMTPAFLKQTSQLEAVAEGDVESAERRRTWKRPIIMRSLSSMIKSLRKEEDDLLDDELRVLHEMEDQSEPVVVRATSPVVDESNLESRDSGVGLDQNLDQEGFLNVDVEEELRQVQAAEAAEAEENGRPKRVYKKKGQKRQTKRNKLQPARRRAKQAQEEPEAEAESGVDVDATNAVATSKQPGDDELPTSEHSEFDDADLSEDVAKPIRKTKKAKQSSKAEPKDDANKAVRKINPNAQSHTNYRRLNIRGNNAKTGGKGRFSRRR